VAVLGLQWKAWTSVIPDVMAACGSSGDSLDVLLQFLSVLPEEANDNRRGVLSVHKFEGNDSLQPEEMQEQIEALLTRNASDVLNLLLEYSQSECILPPFSS